MIHPCLSLLGSEQAYWIPYIVVGHNCEKKDGKPVKNLEKIYVRIGVRVNCRLEKSLCKHFPNFIYCSYFSQFR